MLETLMKFGSHRVDYFDRSGCDPEAFAFYVRGGMDGASRYSHEAKHQLYSGLAVIRASLGLQHLAAVYIDINDLADLQRPAYQQLRRDLLDGLFTRVFVYSGSALLGHPAADADLTDLRSNIRGFELLTCEDCSNAFIQVGLEHADLVGV